MSVVINGTTGITTPDLIDSNGTANGVAYLNGSKVLTTGSALTFDGTNLGLTNGAIRLSNGYEIGWGANSSYIVGNSSSNVLQFITNSSEQMRLTSTGLGIGTSSPASRLDVYSTGNTTLTLSGSSGGGGDVSQIDFFRIGSNVTSSIKAIRDGGNTSGALTFYTAASGTNTERMRLDSSGNLGLGVSSPVAKLDVRGKILSAPTSNAIGSYPFIQGAITDYTPFGVGLNLIVENAGTNRYGLGFTTTDTGSNVQVERARIDPSGNLLVGKSTTSIGTVGSYLSSSGGWFCSGTNGTNFYHVYDTTNSVFRFYVASAGQIYATNTSIIALSDVSLKENIRDLETGLSQVMALKPRRFDWKNGDATNVAGFIAQELEEVLPELVYESMYTENETKKSIKMGDILPTLVKAIQEQQSIIQTLTDRITALEAK